jgi:hypothetical protein
MTDANFADSSFGFHPVGDEGLQRSRSFLNFTRVASLIFGSANLGCLRGTSAMRCCDVFFIGIVSLRFERPAHPISICARKLNSYTLVNPVAWWICAQGSRMPPSVGIRCVLDMDGISPDMLITYGQSGDQSVQRSEGI